MQAQVRAVQLLQAVNPSVRSEAKVRHVEGFSRVEMRRSAFHRAVGRVEARPETA